MNTNRWQRPATIIVMILCWLMTDIAIAKIIPAGYSMIRWQRQNNILIPPESMPIRGETFAAFKANFQATFEQHLFEPVCEGPFSNKIIETQVRVPNSLEHRTRTGSVTIGHTDRNIFCASGGVVRTVKASHRGTFKRYCPTGFDKTDGPDDQNAYCAGPGLTLATDDSAANIVIEATLDDVPAGEYIGQFEITGFSSVEGTGVPPSQWGHVQSSCSLMTDNTGIAECAVSYTPDLPGVATIEGRVDVDGQVYTDEITVEANQLPDLAVDLVIADDAPLLPGQTFTADITLDNIGVVDYAESIDTLIFLSADEIPDTSDRVLVSLTTAGLAAGDTQVSTESLTVPEDVPSGDYQLLVVVNPAAWLEHQQGESPEPPEMDYDNNLASQSVTVQLPKVAVDICVGNPISVGSGGKLEIETDYEGTGPFPLEFARYYSSSPGNPDGWNTSYSRHLHVHDNPDGTTDVILIFDNGLRYEFADIDARGFSDPDVPGLMARTANGFAYLDEDGTLHKFDTAGRLTGLISQAGFTQTLTHQDNRLVRVTDHFGRELHFEYNNADLLKALHTPDGAMYRYEYNDEHLLSAVVLPDDTPDDETDNPRREYIYESPHLDHGLTGIIDENGNRFGTFEYDEQGRAILTSHPGGAGLNTISYTMNETTVTNPLGKRTTYVFEDILGSQRLIRMDGHPTVNCPATTTTKSYDSRGSVTREVDAEGNMTEYTYTHTGLPDNEYLYHVGLVTRRIEAVGTPEQRTIDIEWHLDFRLPVKITESGRRIELTYDEEARLIQREEVALDTSVRRVWRYSYNKQGLLIEVDGPRTDVEDTTQLQYNDEGEVTAVINALGHTTDILAYDDSGLPLTVRDPNGLITRLAYDAQRRLVAQTIASEAGDATTDIDYDARGNVIAMHLPKPAPDEDPGGQTLHYTYDTADRLVRIKNDLGETIEFTLDADGNRTAEITRAAGGSIVRVQNRAFDELSRTIETLGAVGQTTQLGYDNNDNLTQVDDALSRRTDMAFDSLDRLISITDALDGESTFTYDNRDNLTSVTDVKGVTTTYMYDGHNNLLEESSTASGVTRHRYDVAGNRIETVDANGVMTKYDYDALNRLTAIRYPSSPDENIEFIYDEGPNSIGRLTGTQDPSGNTTFQYDPRGSLVTDTRKIKGITYTTNYRYNLGNQLIGITYPSGRLVHYELDNLGRVVAITTQATAASPVKSIASDFDYLPFGPATRWQHGNGLTTDINYDQDYRITDIDVADMDEIMSLTYRYNDVSNITRILDNLGISDQDLQYDALDRLTFASGHYGDIDYTYDGVGNRLSRSIDKDGKTASEAYEYESNSHRITRVTTTNDEGTDTRQFQHDNNGNIVEDSSGKRQLEMIVNARNRLEGIVRDGERVGTYEYNALGQRVAKTSRYRGRLHAHFDQRNKPASTNDSGNGKGNHRVTPTGARKSSNVIPTGARKSSNVIPTGAPEGRGMEGSHTQPNHADTNLHTHYDNKPVTERLHFHYDQAGNLIAESDARGNVIREYIYLGNYRIAMAATSLESPGVTPDAPSVIPDARLRDPGPRHRNQPLALYFIHNDHLGTPQEVTDAQQRVVWSMEQTPFGEVALTTRGIRMPMRFPGQYADVESGFSYNYYRDYDPRLGRYIQSDPIGLAGGIATYVYVQQNPLYYQDPTGKFGIVGGAIGAVVGGVAGAATTILSGGSTADAARAAGTAAIVGAAFGATGGVAGTFGSASLVGSASGALTSASIVWLNGGNATQIAKAALLGAGIGALAGGFGNTIGLANSLALLRAGKSVSGALVRGAHFATLGRAISSIAIGTAINGLLSEQSRNPADRRRACN